ncbi:MAG: hypothetical protein GY725_01690 [bacterium]|nr:hypothetical protein [bacterium]
MKSSRLAFLFALLALASACSHGYAIRAEVDTEPLGWSRERSDQVAIEIAAVVARSTGMNADRIFKPEGPATAPPGHLVSYRGIYTDHGPLARIVLTALRDPGTGRLVFNASDAENPREHYALARIREELERQIAEKLPGVSVVIRHDSIAGQGLAP